MPPPCRPPSLLRSAQALTTLLALAFAAPPGIRLPPEGDACLAAWALCFILTLLLLLAESSGRCPPRQDLPLVHAVAAGSACAAVAVIWSLGHLRGSRNSGGQEETLRALATASSCLATVFYTWEILQSRAKPGQTAPYLATPSGLLKVAETFLALLLLSLAAEQGAGSGPPGWRWSLGIYCVSFVLGVLVVGGCLGGWGCWVWVRDPVGTRRVLGVYAGLGVVAYGAAVVLWPLYGFRDEMGGQEKRPPGCPPSCPWDRRVLVALGTALNLLAYGVDLVQTGRLVLLRG